VKSFLNSTVYDFEVWKSCLIKYCLYYHNHCTTYRHDWLWLFLRLHAKLSFVLLTFYRPYVSIDRSSTNVYKQKPKATDFESKDCIQTYLTYWLLFQRNNYYWYIVSEIFCFEFWVSETEFWIWMIIVINFCDEKHLECYSKQLKRIKIIRLFSLPVYNNAVMIIYLAGFNQKLAINE